MTAGETWDSCLEEIRQLPAVQKYGDDVKVSMYMYDRPAWTGEVYETECFFPTWINKESAAHVQALVDAHHACGATSASAMPTRTRSGTPCTCGRAVPSPTSGPSPPTACPSRADMASPAWLGPGAESQAHAPNEITWKQDLVTCAALYAAVPGNYKEENKTADVSQFRAGKTNNNIQ